MITKLYVKTSLFLEKFKNDERGVTAIEYGLIGVAMAVMLGTVLASGDASFLGKLTAAFTKIKTTLSTLTTGK